jgi:hypothetical protein
MVEHFAVAPDDLQRLRGPIGIYIGSKTPAEIAVSIMAEVLAVKNGVTLPRDMEVAQAKNLRRQENDPAGAVLRRRRRAEGLSQCLGLVGVLVAAPTPQYRRRRTRIGPSSRKWCRSLPEGTLRSDPDPGQCFHRSLCANPGGLRARRQWTCWATDTYWGGFAPDASSPQADKVSPCLAAQLQHCTVKAALFLLAHHQVRRRSSRSAGTG